MSLRGVTEKYHIMRISSRTGNTRITFCLSPESYVTSSAYNTNFFFIPYKTYWPFYTLGFRPMLFHIKAISENTMFLLCLSLCNGSFPTIAQISWYQFCLHQKLNEAYLHSILPFIISFFSDIKCKPKISSLLMEEDFYNHWCFIFLRMHALSCLVAIMLLCSYHQTEGRCRYYSIYWLTIQQNCGEKNNFDDI